MNSEVLKVTKKKIQIIEIIGLYHFKAGSWKRITSITRRRYFCTFYGNICMNDNIAFKGLPNKLISLRNGKTSKPNLSDLFLTFLSGSREEMVLLVKRFI